MIKEQEEQKARQRRQWAEQDKAAREKWEREGAEQKKRAAESMKRIRQEWAEKRRAREAASEELDRKIAEREARDAARQAAEQAARERAERPSCYLIALFEYAIERKGMIVFSEQKAEAHLAAMKKKCFGGANEPPADFQEVHPAFGPRHCHKKVAAMKGQEQALNTLRHEAGDAEGYYKQMEYAKRVGLLSPSDEKRIPGLKKKARKVEKKRQAAEKRFDALYHEADEAGCIADE